MIILSEASDQIADSEIARSLHLSSEIAALAGFSVYHIPPETAGPIASSMLAEIPMQSQKTSGFWLGLLPSPERYRAIYEAAIAKNIRLPNTPNEHLAVQEFDRAYPKIEDLTPKSVVITDVSQCQDAIAQLGLPVFVRGAVHSRKQDGWKACVAATLEELQQLVATLLQYRETTRDRVLVRQLVKLRHDRYSPSGFPIGREYRAIVFRQTVITYGYYWDTDDPLRYMVTVEDENAMLEVVKQAASRLTTPFVAIDVGQQEDGQWIVIETGDPQCSGTGQIPLIQLWKTLRDGGLT